MNGREVFNNYDVRVWFSGRTSPCHGEDGGSIPPTRSKEKILIE
jgi:hypothetical protein